MVKFVEEGKYKIVATKYKTDDLIINIGFIEKFPPKEYFLINKFKHGEKNNKIFKEMLIYFNSKNKFDYFYDFFSLGDYFYVVFKYNEEPNLDYRYNKNLCLTDFRRRIKIFESICIKIKNISRSGFPFNLISSSINPDNISVSENDDIFFNFDFRSIYDNIHEEQKYNENKNKYLVMKLSKIFGIIFETEISSRYNKIMEMMFKKCSLGIYKSIEEMVLDLKNNTEEAEISSFIGYIKHQFRIRKYLIPKITKMVFVPSLILVFGYLVYKKVNGLNYATNENSSFTIGEITYSGDGNDESAKSVDLDMSMKSKLESESKNKKVYLPENSEVEFDDYIVKQGDTPSSISESQYSDKSFGSAITSFNSVSGNLVPGTILRIPSKSAVESLSKSN